MPSIHANKWFVDYNSLDKDQQRLVDGGVFQNGSSIALINGPAGSGKTIILVNALTKADTKSVAFVSYTRSLLNLADQGLPGSIKGMTYFEAKKTHTTYDLVVVDEVQDVPVMDLKTIIQRAKKVILAGDNFQKIFDQGADSTTLSSIANGNVHKLLKTYRLTPKAFAAASKINPGALEGVLPSGKSVVPIELYYTDEYDKGNNICYQLAKKQASLQRTSAILLPTKDAIVEFANWVLAAENKPVWILERNQYSKPKYDSLNRHLKAHSVKLQVVQNEFGDLNDAFDNNQVVLQTYHSAKGLDFQTVCLPNASVESAVRQSLQKALFYVAITRASGALIITQQKNNVSPFVKSIEEFCSIIDPNRITTNKDEEDEF